MDPWFMDPSVDQVHGPPFMDLVHGPQSFTSSKNTKVRIIQ